MYNQSKESTIAMLRRMQIRLIDSGVEERARVSEESQRLTNWDGFDDWQQQQGVMMMVDDKVITGECLETQGKKKKKNPQKNKKMKKQDVNNTTIGWRGKNKERKKERKKNK